MSRKLKNASGLLSLFLVSTGSVWPSTPPLLWWGAKRLPCPDMFNMWHHSGLSTPADVRLTRLRLLRSDWPVHSSLDTYRHVCCKHFLCEEDNLVVAPYTLQIGHCGTWVKLESKQVLLDCWLYLFLRAHFPIQKTLMSNDISISACKSSTNKIIINEITVMHNSAI